jgi:hypothetical protein
MTKTKIELGTRVRAKRDFPVYWKIGRGKKIADIKEGMEGIVTGFDRGIPIVNVVDYYLPVTLEPFDDLWEVTCKPGEWLPYWLDTCENAK